MKSATCQDTLIKLIQGTDTLVCLKHPQLTALNRQISLLSTFKLTAEYTITRADSLIANYKSNQTTLKEIIVNKDSELANNQKEIGNLNLIIKKNKKRMRKTILFSCAGSAAIGVIAGIIMRR